MAGSYLWISLNLLRLLFKLSEIGVEFLHSKLLVLETLTVLKIIEDAHRVFVYEHNNY